MGVAWFIVAVLVVGGGLAAMTLRHLIHCALCLAVCLVGVACCYLGLGAAFLGWVQILVYVGAVAILVVFAILLTRSGEAAREPVWSTTWLMGVGVAVLFLAVMAGSIATSPTAQQAGGAAPALTVRQIGESLMTQYVLPLEVAGVLLTAAMLGAVLIALEETRKK